MSASPATHDEPAVLVPSAAQGGDEPDGGDPSAGLKGANGLDLVVELAHDLRSPLTSILFLAEALQQGQGGTVTETQSRQLGLIYGAAFDLCATASDVLELAIDGRELVERVPASFSVAETFASVRSMVLPIAEQKGLDVRLVYPVPERREGHQRALARVLLNLASNAVKFTDSGFVELAARPIGTKRLEFSMRDTGVGIDRAVLDHLYQPVRPSPASGSQHFSSSGLGLAICRKLVRAMGAELHAETWRSWGTRFFFEIACPPAGAA